MVTMAAAIFCLVLLLLDVTCVVQVGTQFTADKPMGKTWWAKRVNEELFIAGRLSDIQIKYASEDGFKSVISVYNHRQPGRFGFKELVSTDAAKDISERLSGMDFYLLCDEDHSSDDVKNACWRGINTIKKFDQLFKKANKPVLLYSNTGYSAAFVGLSWLLLKTQQGVIHDSKYQINAQDVYIRASALGYDFSQEEDLQNILEEVSGEHVDDPASPDLSLPDWHKVYWWAKPVEKNWFIAGQIWSEHLDLITELGINVLINSRMGTRSEDPESGDVYECQEEVTLLNVNEDCWTYCPGGRQSTKQLLANRIDPNKPGEYIGKDNSDEENYMARNPQEFGDDVGYNETVQQVEVSQYPLQYIHTPLENCDEMKFKLYNKTWEDAHNNGNVLMHCRTGCRAVVPCLLTLGVAMEKDVYWAIEKARLIGYDFPKEVDSDVWELFESILTNGQTKQAGPKTEL